MTTEIALKKHICCISFWQFLSVMIGLTFVEMLAELCKLDIYEMVT